jgi:DNA-binding protein H-NS
MATKSKSVASMSIEALLNLREEIADAIASRASDLQKQLSRLTGTETKRGRPPGRKSGRGAALRGKKLAPQFCSKKDPKMVWAGRGVTPRWMVAEMKGTKLKKENFRIK